MTKYGVIVPTCFLLLSGCALFDPAGTTTEAPMAAVPVTENEEAKPTTASIAISDPQLIEPPPPTPRPLTADEIRDVQTRLHKLRLDPGPVDGIAGVRTQAAMTRLHHACAKLAPLIERFYEPEEKPTHSFSPASKEETRYLQSQLRGAGFDPGPVDGILGRRTKSTVNELHDACLMAKAFSSRVEMDGSAARASNRNEPAAVPSMDSSSAYLPKPAVAVDAAPVKSTRIIAEPRSREDVRILQLRLRDAGFDPGPFDGIMGPKTRAALAQYEASRRVGKIKTNLRESIDGEHY